MDYPGGFITKTAPTLNPALGNAAPGVWRLNDVLKNIKAGTWPSYDPYFENTTLLLHGNGTNGGQNNTFLDSSSNNFTITRNGNTTQGTFSPFSQTGWSNYFDGSGDYLNTATNVSGFDFGTGDFTVECWVYHLALSSQCVIFYGVPSSGSLPASDFGWAIDTASSNTPRFFFYSGSTQVTVSAAQTMPVNQWVHYAVTRASGSLKFFINGTQSGSTVSSSASVNTSTTFATRIGLYGPYGDDRYFNGYMSSLRVVKGTAIYTSNFTPPTAPLTAISGTSLLTCQSNRFVDNSASPLTLTVNGNTSVQAFSPFAPTAAYSASTVGGSGYFDGSGDYLTVETAAESALNLTGTFTFEFWFYRNATGDIQLFSKGGGQNNWNTTNGIAYQALIETSTFKWQFSIGGGSLVSIDVTAPAISQWVHVAVGRNGTTTRVWVNGSSIGTSTSTPTPPSTRNIIYAAANQTGGNNVNGYMAGLRIVNGTDVYGVSNTSITVPTSPPTNISNTSLLLNFTNAAIIDNTAKNVLETVGNAQISTAQSKFGGASLYFDGNGDYLIMPDAQTGQFLTGDFTVEYWCRFGSQGTNYAPQVGTLTSASPSGTWRFGTFTNNGGVYLAYHNGSTFVDVQFGSTAYNDNTWRHFALTRSGTTVRAFVDGTQVGTNQTVSQNFNSSNKVSVGAELLNPTYFNGYIDDLRITKGIARYTSNFTPQTSQWQDQ